MTLEQLRDALHGRANALADPLTRRLARAGVTPDGITYAGLALSGAAAGFLVAGMPRTAAVAWLLGSALDMLDGALARHTGAVNRAGAFLDSSLDRISEGLLLSAAAYHFAVLGQAPAAAASAYALLMSLMVSYTRARAEALGVECKGGVATRVERVILLGAGLLFNVLAAVVGLLAVLATITTVQRLVHGRSALSGRAGTAPGPRSGQG